MGDWQKTIDALVEAWEKFTTSIKEMVDALNKACLLYTSPSPRD